MFSKRDVVLAQEYLGFLLLNMFDLFLTGWIFKYSGEEANGIAAWVLVKFHLEGFAIYKFLMVIFLIVICEVIAMFSIQRARLVILGGCAVYVLVILYECFLIYSFIDRPQVDPAPSDETSLRMQMPPVERPVRFFV